MIRTNYVGGVGNNMFQYVFARIIAEQNNLYLAETVSNPITEFKVMSDKFPVDTIPYDTTDKIILTPDYSDVLYIGGYFQDPRIYDLNKDLIKSFFDYEINKRTDGSVTAHIRLGDYHQFDGGVVIHPNWYRKRFKKLGCGTNRKLYIVSDDINDPYMENFKEFNPEFVSSTVRSDFQFIMNSDIIVSSNSTFSWWASWLSEASKIFMFSPWIYKEHHRKFNLAYMDRATLTNGAFLKEIE